MKDVKLKLNEDLIIDMIDEWDLSGSKDPLWKYLGLTKKEYIKFIKGDYEIN